MSEVSCPNCAIQTMGNYCHSCGQKQNIQRLTLRYLVEDLQKRIFGFDNNYFRTIRDLTIRPGAVIETIIRGIRVKYVGPIGYYFVMLTIYILLVSMLDIDLAELTNPLVSEPQSEFERNFQNQLGSSIFSNFRVTSFLMAPFFISGVWLVFKNKKYNFLETSVVYFYGQGHTFIVSIIFLFIYYFNEDVSLAGYLLPISIIYFAFACASFYPGNAIWNFIKAILGLALGYLLLMIVFLVGFIGYIALNPEVLEQIKQGAGG